MISPRSAEWRIWQSIALDATAIYGVIAAIALALGAALIAGNHIVRRRKLNQ